jgi:hypothetical protein
MARRPILPRPAAFRSGSFFLSVKTPESDIRSSAGFEARRDLGGDYKRRVNPVYHPLRMIRSVESRLGQTACGRATAMDFGFYRAIGKPAR